MATLPLHKYNDRLEEHLVLFPICYSEVCINVIEDTDYNVQTYDSSKLL